jgi:hypothetical protein
MRVDGHCDRAHADLNALLRQANPDQNTISAGARWDFMKNLDLKLEADHTRLGADSYGRLINVQPELHAGVTVNIFSATIDFVF